MNDHPRVHPHIPWPRVSAGLNDRIADRVAGWFGSMSCFYLLVAWQISWMVLATLGVWLFKNDQFPFAFCLFLSNLIQLWALPILGTTTNRADVKRQAKIDADHAALTYLATQLDAVVSHLAVHKES